MASKQIHLAALTWQVRGLWVFSHGRDLSSVGREYDMAEVGAPFGGTEALVCWQTFYNGL